MTTTPERTNAELFSDARRARSLRWLLKLRTAHNLPMPKRIDFTQFTSKINGRTLRCLLLDLDDDTDVTAWANAVNANRRDRFPVVGDTRTWTHVVARTDWRDDGPRVDWHLIEITSNHCDRLPADLESVAR